MGKGTSFDTLASEAPERRQPPPLYIDLDTLKNSEGLVGIISQRTSNGVITFGVFKEFERDGRAERTAFFAENMRKSYQDLIALVLERIDQIKADPKLLAELQKKAGYEPPARNGRRK